MAAGWRVCYTDTARGRPLLAGALRLDPPWVLPQHVSQRCLGPWLEGSIANEPVGQSLAGSRPIRSPGRRCPFQQHTRGRGHWGRDRQTGGRAGQTAKGPTSGEDLVHTCSRVSRPSPHMHGERRGARWSQSSAVSVCSPPFSSDIVSAWCFSLTTWRRALPAAGLWPQDAMRCEAIAPAPPEVRSSPMRAAPPARTCCFRPSSRYAWYAR